VILALLVSLVCLGVPGPVTVQVTVVKRFPDGVISSTDARCNLAPCWTVFPGERGCALAGACGGPVGYVNVDRYPNDVQWGLFKQSDVDGCVDLDLLPIPRDDWTYWLRVAP
jgi:hypothetical protein